LKSIYDDSYVNRGGVLKSVKIGICGLGTVGCGTVNVLRRNRREIELRTGIEFVIEQIGARRNNPNCDTNGLTISRDIFDVVNNPNIDIVVELIGGTTVAKTLILQAIANRKHVVTANKALIAECGDEIFAKAQKQGVTVAFEAAVAGSIPVIKMLREGLSANRIEWIAGIINGTSNFILTEMCNKGRDFADVLKEAQALGYAEADPTFDVEGIDAAHKLAILASLAFAMPLQFDKVFVEGISTISPADIYYAGQLGYRIKHLGIARRLGEKIELRVHPTLVPKKRLIANVDGVMNAILVKGDAAGPTLYYGAGAGAEATASAVISDIIDIARHGSKYLTPSYGFHQVTEKPVLPIEEIETAYYVRLTAEDKPGVLSKITQIFSIAGISIEAVNQREPETVETEVVIVLLTSRAIEKDLLAVVKTIETLENVHGKVIHIRVESLQ
jgi:homoserine dehydrogenase